MIRMIVSDLDGTLLPYGQERIEPALWDLWQSLSAAGAETVISTGRTYSELREILGEAAEGMTLICCDGACYRRGGRTVYERPIASEDIARFFALRREGESFLLHGAERTYGVGALPREAERFAPLSIRTPFEIKEKIFKITAYGMRPTASFSGLRVHWDGGAHNGSQWVNRFANKGTALSDLQTRLMISGFDTACIGDSDNDLPMMRGVKLSFCVGDRSPALAASCNRKVSSARAALEQLLTNA